LGERLFHDEFRHGVTLAGEFPTAGRAVGAKYRDSGFDQRTTRIDATRLQHGNDVILAQIEFLGDPRFDGLGVRRIDLGTVIGRRDEIVDGGRGRVFLFIGRGQGKNE